MNNTIRRLIVAALIAGAPALFAASSERKEAQAQILEQESFPCVNCFLGAAHYFFCFAADNNILIAQDRIFSFNWTDGQRSYFGKVYKPWRVPTPAGQSITIQYDKEHVWMPRTDGKPIRLKRGDSSDVFTNPQCRSAAAKPAGK